MTAPSAPARRAGRRPGKRIDDDAEWARRMALLCSRCGQRTLDAEGRCTSCGAWKNRRRRRRDSDHGAGQPLRRTNTH